MIKMLTRALGTVHPKFGVIGRVDRSGTGKSIIEIGKSNEDGSWTKVPDGGHVALGPEERAELIRVLESHENHQTLKVGDIVGGPLGATVLAVAYHETGMADPGRKNGVVLAYSDHKREYWVWRVNAAGELEHGYWSHDAEKCLNRYAARLIERLYAHGNRSAPKLTFDRVPNGSALES
ncbi:hypothetical protein [Streptomyces cucumeris]|uniref:hypothetical protein n=1 Tax=Streptomyces cucumeris TaxID=2962890 RepID=UPI0020C842FB|nr:hypothetical protein [Streptomyces sp. NEAU-Y11]MCP9209562.1 hypothetical protein [Streptomyces sp. NEAU-Y11]